MAKNFIVKKLFSFDDKFVGYEMDMAKTIKADSHDIGPPTLLAWPNLSPYGVYRHSYVVLLVDIIYDL